MGRLGKSPAPICIRRPIGWEGFRQNIAVTFGTEKLEWYSYTMVKKMKICLFVLTECMYERDRHTGRQRDD